MAKLPPYDPVRGTTPSSPPEQNGPTADSFALLPYLIDTDGKVSPNLTAGTVEIVVKSLVGQQREVEHGLSADPELIYPVPVSLNPDYHATIVQGSINATTFTVRVDRIDGNPESGNVIVPVIYHLVAMEGATLLADFTPDLLSDMRVWLEADQITGKTPGDTVTLWPDTSGNGRDFTQDGGLSVPLYQEDQGFPTVRFGHNQRLIGPDDSNNIFAGGTGMTMFVVAARTTITSRIAQLFRQDRSASDWPGPGTVCMEVIHDNELDGSVGETRGPSVRPSTLNAYKTSGYAWDSAWHIWEITFTSGATEHTLRHFIDGTLKDTTVPSTDHTLPWPDTGYDVATLGMDGGLADPRKLDLAELLIYGRPLNASERTQIRDYLSDKYSIATA